MWGYRPGSPYNLLIAIQYLYSETIEIRSRQYFSFELLLMHSLGHWRAHENRLYFRRSSAMLTRTGGLSTIEGVNLMASGSGLKHGEIGPSAVTQFTL